MDKRHLFIHTCFLTICFFFSFIESTKASELSAILYDYDTGRVLYEKNPDEAHFPASLTKMMTLYVTFQALSHDRLSLNSQLPVSYQASIQEPSKLGLAPGQYVCLQDLVLGTATNSSNDAATVLAEGIGGDIPTFSNIMNTQAQRLGMLNTYFENPTGLPNPRQTTTARDMLKLAIALRRDFPQYYPIFGTRYFDYKGRQYKNHNHLLYNYTGTDGIKTGYIRAEGYNLVGSASRSGRRLVAVVLGGKTSQTRDKIMEWLFDRGFGGSKNFDEATMPKNVEPVSHKATHKKIHKHKSAVKPHHSKAKAAKHTTKTSVTKVKKHAAKKANSKKKTKQQAHRH